MVPEEERRGRREIEVREALQGAEILAQVSDLQIIAGKRYNEAEKLIETSAGETLNDGEVTKLFNVVIKTPEFTFKADQASAHHGIVQIVGTPIEVERNGRTYYSYSPIAVAQRSGSVLYVLSKHADLLTQREPTSSRIEFRKIMDEAN